MKNRTIEEILRTIKEMQVFNPVNDELTKMIDSYNDSCELGFDELSYVAAAGETPYQHFMDRIKLDNDK